MRALTVTSGGQIALCEDVLQHLGIEPGDKIHVDLLPDSRVQLSAERSKETMGDLQGFLRGKTNGRKLSVEEIGDAIAEAGAVPACANNASLKIKLF